MAELSLRKVKKVYDNTVVAVQAFDLEIADKEFIVLVGPSGCGKSTTLRMVAGLEDITDGEIYIAGRKVNSVPPKDRDIAMVFQNYALYPHMTVYDNIAYGLRLRKFPKRVIDQKVREAAEILDITELLKRKPKALSGGQRQRVAIGRAIVREPKVLLMDEPLSNLDAKLRVEMRTVIKRIQHEVGITTIYVTHDQEEAMAISDRIAVMKDGVIHHCGRPDNIYQRPADVFVATFIGKTNLLAGQMSEENGQAYITVCGSGRIPFHTIRPDAVGSREVILSIRPEEFKVWRDGETSEGLRATIRDSVFLGPNTHYFAQLENGEEVEIIQESEIDSMIRPGSSILLTINAGKANVFDKETSLSLMTGVKHSVELPEVGA